MSDNKEAKRLPIGDEVMRGSSEADYSHSGGEYVIVRDGDTVYFYYANEYDAAVNENRAVGAPICSKKCGSSGDAEQYYSELSPDVMKNWELLSGEAPTVP